MMDFCTRTLLISFFAVSLLTSEVSAMYDPSLGRFLSRDPLGYVDGANLVATGRSVTRWADPLGLSSDLIPPQESCSQFLSSLPELIAGNDPIPGVPPSILGRLRSGGDYVFCGNCGEHVQNLSWNQNGRCHICLSDTAQGYPDQWLAILMHELLHCNQYKCKKRGVPIEPGPPVPLPGGQPGGPNCGFCISHERPAYELQCKYLFPTSKEKQKKCVDAGLCHSCAGPCKESKSFKKGCEKAVFPPFYPEPLPLPPHPPVG